MLIVYGMELMHPAYFYPATCLVCAIIALSIGSSWTVAGTLGVALIGVAQGMDMSAPITAGAIISGAYFGDKMSPMSDTTIIAPAAAGAELFAHIRHLTWTTFPSLAIALVLFTFIGLNSASASNVEFGDLAMQLQAHYSLGDLELAREGFAVSVRVLGDETSRRNLAVVEQDIQERDGATSSTSQRR